MSTYRIWSRQGNTITVLWNEGTDEEYLINIPRSAEAFIEKYDPTERVKKMRKGKPVVLPIKPRGIPEGFIVTVKASKKKIRQVGSNINTPSMGN